MKTKQSLISLAICSSMWLTGCKEFADDPILHQQLLQTISSSTTVSKLAVDIDQDGDNDLFFNAYNNDDFTSFPVTQDNGLFLEDISTTYDFDFIYTESYTSPFAGGQLHLLRGVAEMTEIGPSTSVDGTSWKSLQEDSRYKFLISGVADIAGGWYSNTLDASIPVQLIFLPFRAVRVADGSPLYGWIKLKDARTDDYREQKMNVVAIAFNTLPGSTILAGQQK